MISLVVLSLLLLGSHTNAQECIDTAEKYTAHLGDLLNDANTVEKSLCEGTELMTRIQSLYDKTKWPKLPESLNQYGGYWTFASGADVAGYFLTLGKKYSGDKSGFITAALYYVGFGAGGIYTDGSTKYIMVVFDQGEMDSQWQAGAPDGNFPWISFQPLWGNVFSYLENEFQLCYNPDSGWEDGLDTVSRPEHCDSATAVIPEEARVKIISTNYTELTGCNEGYPMPDLRESPDACAARCPGTNGVQYCNATQTLGSASYQGSIECIDTFNTERGALMDETLWARAFFEKCLSFSSWFTGLGLGYSPEDKHPTGSEYLVRGDIALETLAYSEYVLIEWS